MLGLPASRCRNPRVPDEQRDASSATPCSADRWPNVKIIVRAWNWLSFPLQDLPRAAPVQAKAKFLGRGSVLQYCHPACESAWEKGLATPGKAAARATSIPWQPQETPLNTQQASPGNPRKAR
eukprot:23840-Chlamydomonas_euryale.AAC.7